MKKYIWLGNGRISYHSCHHKGAQGNCDHPQILYIAMVQDMEDTCIRMTRIVLLCNVSSKSSRLAIYAKHYVTVILWVLLDYDQFSQPKGILYYIQCSSGNPKRLALHVVH